MVHDMRKVVRNETTDLERAYYGSAGVSFYSIKIMGPADGESAFKECRNIDINNSTFKLRYPFWHNTNADYYRIDLKKTARAPWWYDKNITLNKVKCKGVKALNITEKNGNMAALRKMVTNSDLMIITDIGIVIRISTDQISKLNRNTQGVRLINLKENQKVSTIAIVETLELGDVEE